MRFQYKGRHQQKWLSSKCCLERDLGWGWGGQEVAALCYKLYSTVFNFVPNYISNNGIFCGKICIKQDKLVGCG